MCQQSTEVSSLLSRTSEGDGKPRLNPLAKPYSPPQFSPQKLFQHHQFPPPRLAFSSWGCPLPVRYYLNPQRHRTFRARPIKYGEHVAPRKPYPDFDGDVGKKVGKVEAPRNPFCRERKRDGVSRFVPPRSMGDRNRHGYLIRSFCGGKKWVQKQHDSSNENKRVYDEAVLGKAWVGAANATSDDVVLDDPQVILNGSTTVMIRNIPNQFKRKDLLSVLDEHCEGANAMAASDEDPSEYDFVYLPMDFKTEANKGYAFVNFTYPTGASRMYQAYHNFRWECLPIKNLIFRCKKVCEISPAKIQGKVALEWSFKNRAFPYEEYQPVIATESPSDGRQKKSRLIVVGKCPGAASARKARGEAPMLISRKESGGRHDT